MGIKLSMVPERIRVNVYISYSRDDVGAELSRDLSKHIQEKGYDAFLDVSPLSVGAKRKLRIGSIIDHCDVFVLIVTAGSVNSDDIEEEYISATSKRKVTMLFKHRSVQVADLSWGLNDRKMYDFDSKEELLQIFDERFAEIDNLLKHDLNDPLVVQEKLNELKKEFDLIPEDIDEIKRYTDNVFIPIVTFLNKSRTFYAKEKVAIKEILDRATILSLSIEEKKESSEEVFAKINADMLRLNLSRFLGYLLDLFVKNTPEMRLQLLQSASHKRLYEGVHVEPMATEAKDFLIISVDRTLSENLKYEYFKQAIENQKIDIRYFYLTPESVDLWFKIVNFSDYKFNEYGRENIKKNASDLINVIFEKFGPGADRVDLIDLGVGAAVKDYYLLKPLLEKIPRDGIRMNYVPVDYSVTMLQRVMDYMDQLMDLYPNKLHIEGVLGDFYRLPRYKKRIDELSESPKVFALLGNILGNVEEGSILSAITTTMNPNDLFLLEIDLIDNRTDDKLTVGFGSDGITKNFLLSPILKHSPKYKRTGVKIEDFELEVGITKSSIIPNSKTVMISAYYGENNRERMNLVQSHKYDLQSVVDYLYTYWSLGHIKTYKYSNSCLLLLQKLPIEGDLLDAPTISQLQSSEKLELTEHGSSVHV